MKPPDRSSPNPLLRDDSAETNGHPRSPRRFRRLFVRGILLAVVLLSTPIAWNFASGNFGVVAEGRFYRSAQMTAAGLGRTVRDYGIKTVINLRGHHPEAAWYRNERDSTLEAGAVQVDMALSSCDWMSRTQLRTLVDVLDTSKPPVLVHCWRGAERTGLASAFAVLLREGSTLAEAKAEFSPAYLFLRMGDGVTTIEHLEQYECWLARLGETHTPARFRQWVAEGFVPGTPSRETWPYDPYPLVVTTRPGVDGPVVRKVWDDRGRAEAGVARLGDGDTAPSR